MTDNPAPVRVAIALVHHLGAWLIGRRPEGVPLAGMWEFPGGKVKPGETPPQAAVRECREETGLHVAADETLEVVRHRYPHGEVELHFIVCRCDGAAGAPPAASPPWQWTPTDRLQDYEFPAANATILQRLIRGDGNLEA